MGKQTYRKNRKIIKNQIIWKKNQINVNTIDGDFNDMDDGQWNFD